VSLDHLQPVDGPIGRCFALVTPDGERSFAISEGKMNALRRRASIPAAVFERRLGAGDLGVPAALPAGRPDARRPRGGRSSSLAPRGSPLCSRSGRAS
jgi:sugar/nucleoside kinase (ribokinase family)